MRGGEMRNKNLEWTWTGWIWAEWKLVFSTPMRTPSEYSRDWVSWSESVSLVSPATRDIHAVLAHNVYNEHFGAAVYPTIGSLPKKPFLPHLIKFSLHFHLWKRKALPWRATLLKTVNSRPFALFYCFSHMCLVFTL